MAKKHKHEEHENHERWLVSYADFITLLFAFFVVMYSVSSVNEGKFRTVSESIQAALHPVTSPPQTHSKIDIGDFKSSLIPQMGPKTQFVQRLQTAVAIMKGQLAPVSAAKPPAFLSKDEGIVITIGDSTLFESGRADLRPEALPLLESLADPLLHPSEGMTIASIRVEGHTDDVPIQTAQFPSNWELSSARAVMVVRVLTEVYGVNPVYFSAAGYGPVKPVTDNDTPEGRAKNRRVEIIVHTD